MVGLREPPGRAPLHPMADLVPGTWYYGVICSGCGLPVYGPQDKHRGTRPIRFEEPGILRFVCHGCSRDEFYRTADLHLLQAL